jgi:uncharacterized protein YuzE
MAFDYVQIQLKTPKSVVIKEFQTKSLDCEYEYYLINNDGYLQFIDYDQDKKEIHIPQSYTGEMEIYDGVSRFMIDMENGKVTAITCMKTQEKLNFSSIINVT